MYYDDETRRFNLVSGLVFGLVLGAGLALLGAPQERVPSIGSVRGRRSRRGKGFTDRLERAREGVAEGAGERLSAAASTLERWMDR